MRRCCRISSNPSVKPTLLSPRARMAGSDWDWRSAGSSSSSMAARFTPAARAAARARRSSSVCRWSTPRDTLEPCADGAAALEGLRVLLVEDEIVTRAALERVLGDAGAEVVAVDNAQAA